jgi:hypothetical protein
LPFFTPIESLFSHALVGCVVFLALFLLICSFFAGSGLVSFLRGILRTGASVFASPLVYVRKSVAELATYGKQGDSLLGTTDQYLINKVLLIVRAATIVVSVAVLAGSLVVGWYAMLPPEPLRLEIDAIQKELNRQKQELSDSSAKLAQMDTDWQTKRTVLIDQRKSELTQKYQDATKTKDDLISQIGKENQGGLENVLGNVTNYLEGNGNYSYGTLEQRINKVREDVQRSSLPDQLKNDLGKYIDNWYQAKKSQQELGSLSEDSTRSSVQPDWGATKGAVDGLKGSIPSIEQELGTLNAEAKYHPEELLKFALYGFLEFLGLIWLWGLLHEAVSLAVHMAGDLKRIRQNVEERKTDDEPLALTAATGD